MCVGGGRRADDFEHGTHGMDALMVRLEINGLELPSADKIWSFLNNSEMCA